MEASIITLHEMYEVSGDGWDSSILEVVVYSEELTEAKEVIN